MMFVRTCQECGHQQKSKDPATYKGSKESWRDTKCRKCKSESLDYGSYKPETPEEIIAAEKEFADFAEGDDE